MQQIDFDDFQRACSCIHCELFVYSMTCVLCGVSVLMLQQSILSAAVYSLVQSLSLYNIVDDLIICAIVSYYVRYSMVPRQPFASLDRFGSTVPFIDEIEG